MVRRLQSMQLRLLAYLSAGVVLVWLAAAVWTWVDVHHEVDELLDSHLAQAASSRWREGLVQRVRKSTRALPCKCLVI